MPESTSRFRAALIGCGRMGRNQAKILASHDDYELVGLCDLDEANRQAGVELTGAPAFADVGEMLDATRPDMVAITTPNTSHAPLTIAAAKAGVRAVYCEKPMATNLADGRRMVAACRDAGCRLIINHQRRISPDLVAMRQIIEAGDLGEVYLVRGQCAGDVLSDGTHLIDSIRFLLGDLENKWVTGQIDLPIETRERYGHDVEVGGMAVTQIGDTRVELFCGNLIELGSAYQEYEVVGTRGRMLRTGDREQPNLFVSDGGAGGPLHGKLYFKPYPRRPHDEPQPWPDKEGGEHPAPPDDDRPSMWRSIEVPPRTINAIADGYARLADQMRRGDEAPSHPMDGEIALAGFELVMAIYESARRNRRIEFPLGDDFPKQFPLELMLQQRRDASPEHAEPSAATGGDN